MSFPASGGFGQQLAREPLHQEILSEPEHVLRIAAGRATEVERTIRIIILDHQQHDDVRRASTCGLIVASIVSLLEHLRLAHFLILRKAVGLHRRHVQRRALGHRPLAPAIDRGPLRRIVLDRPGGE